MITYDTPQYDKVETVFALGGEIKYLTFLIHINGTDIWYDNVSEVNTHRKYKLCRPSSQWHNCWFNPRTLDTEFPGNRSAIVDDDIAAFMQAHQLLNT